MMLYFNEYIQNLWFYHEKSLEWGFGRFPDKNSLTFAVKLTVYQNKIYNNNNHLFQVWLCVMYVYPTFGILLFNCNAIVKNHMYTITALDHYILMSNSFTWFSHWHCTLIISTLNLQVFAIVMNAVFLFLQAIDHSPIDKWSENFNILHVLKCMGNFLSLTLHGKWSWL